MMIDLFSSHILPNTVPEDEGESVAFKYMQYSAISPLKGHKDQIEGTGEFQKHRTNASFAASPIKVRMQNTEEDSLDASRVNEIIEDKRNQWRQFI
jgi:hypothetical protein